MRADKRGDPPVRICPTSRPLVLPHLLKWKSTRTLGVMGAAGEASAEERERLQAEIRAQLEAAAATRP